MRNKWTEDKIILLKDLYGKKTSNELSKIFNTSPQAIKTFAHRINITNPIKYNYNVDFFKTWSSDMAYILGFITADGHIFYDNKKGNYGLKVELSIKDIDILKFICEKICPEYVIKFCSRQTKIKLCELCYISFGSKEIAESLMGFGLIPQKTGNEILPKIPEEFKGDYLRGLFDGDGSISIRQRYHKKGWKNGTDRRFCIASKSKLFLESVKDNLCFGYGTIGSVNGCNVLYIYKTDNILRISERMYKNKGFSLSRKREVIEQI